MRYLVIAALMLCSTTLLAESSLTPYLQTDEYLHMEISPDGKTIAASVFDGEEYAIVFLDSEKFDVIDVMKLRYPDALGPFRWVDKKRLVINVFRYSYNADGYFTIGELLSAKVSDTKGKYIFGYRAGKQDSSTSRSVSIAAKHRNMSRAWNDVIDVLEDDPEHILVAAKPWTADRAADTHIYKVNVEDGNIFPVAIFKKPYARVFTDGQGNLVGAWHITSDFKADVYLYEQTTEQWLPVKALQNVPGVNFYYYDAKQKQLVFTSRMNSNTEALYAYDIASDSVISLYHNENADIAWLQQVDRHLPAYAAVIDNGSRQYIPLNQKNSVTQLFMAMVNGFKGHNVSIISQDKSGEKVLFTLSNDRQPVRFFMFDAKKGKPVIVAQSNKALASNNHVTRVPFRFDFNSKVVRGFITLPDEADKAPAIVVLNRSPQQRRFYSGFSRVAQMYASNGYAVIELNLPGSDGLGKRRDEIGIEQWQPEQYKLITETLNKLGQSYPVDSGNACITGRDWGAYMAIMAARYHPQSFKCVVAEEGLYDFDKYMDKHYLKSFTFYDAYMRLHFGGTAEALDSFNLKNHIAQLTVPTQFLHAEYAKLQPYDDVEDIYKALKKKGGAVRIHEIEKTSRNSEELKEKIKAQKVIFDFLEKHLD